MEESDRIEEYLERVLEFKHRKELHPEYLEEEEREALLEELVYSLGFNKEVWRYAKEHAEVYYHIHDELDSGSEFENKHPKTAKRLIKEYLQKAVYLDPFNKKYLEEYVVDNKWNWESEYNFKVQYAQLFSPSSTECTSIQIDLGIKPADLTYDFLHEDIIGPLINELVFLKEKIIHEQPFKNKIELEELAKQAGVQDETLKELNDEIDEMINVVEGGNSEQWKEIHKAYLTVDRLVELAPYNPQALKAAIQFYGASLWSSQISTTSLNKKVEGFAAFHEVIYDSLKPTKEQRLAFAESSLNKAIELHKRYQSLPTELVKSDDDDFFSKGYDAYLRSITGDYSMAHIEAFVEAQKIKFQVYKAFFEFDSHTFKYAVIWAVALYGSCALICHFVFGSVTYLLTFVMVPAFAVLGILHLRLMAWKRKELEISQ